MASGADLLVRGIGRLLTMAAPPLDGPAAVVIRDGRVAWTGADADLPSGPDLPTYDANGACVVPGFVDPHTHAVWAGTRRDDFLGRLSGEGYRPGGIATTVAATRAASYDDLVDLAQRRIDTAVAGG